MAIDISIEWLKSLKVSESIEELEELIELATSELELRVGKRIASELSESQVQEFENLAENDRLEWLEHIMPDYEKYVNEQYLLLNNEIKDSEDKPALISSWN